MVVKLFLFRLKRFEYLRLELLFYLLGATVEVISIYLFLSFLLGGILEIDDSDILFILGMQRFLIGVARTFYLGQLLLLPSNFRNGSLDLFFLAPISSKIYYCFSGFTVQEVLNIIFGFIVLMLSFQSIGVWEFLLIILCMVLANILLFSMFLILTSLLAAKVNSGPLNAIFINIFSLAQFRSEFFPVPINVILKFLLPVGLLAWGPLTLIRNPNIVDWSLFICITLVALVAQDMAWTRLEKRYSSAN